MKKKNYKISVIVAVYNAHDYLEQCIDSILLQTYENLELLLIDDESTDEVVQSVTDMRIRMSACGSSTRQTAAVRRHL